MKRMLFFALALALSGGAIASTTTTTTTAAKKTSPAHSMPDHAMVAPDDIKWGPPPAKLPAGAEFAVIAGDPNAAGLYAVRLKMPDGYRIMPHTHPTQENITVMSGTFHLGTGATFDDTKGMALPTGGFGYVGPNMKHFAWAEGETVVQVHGMGPFKITYVNPADDPSATAAKP